MKRILTVVLAVLCLAACKKDDTLLNMLDSMGDVNSTTIYADNGVTFRVTKVICDGGFDAQERIAFSCNVLRKVADHEYEIELLGWNRVLRKDFLLSGNADPLVVGDDPVKISRAWSSGIYLNMEIETTLIKGSDTKHYINLVLDESSSTEDTLHFTLRHNGYGESVRPDGDLGFDDVVFGRSYVSFPVQNLIPRGGAMNVTVDWDWYVTQDGGYTLQTKTNTLSGHINSIYSN